MSTRVYLPDETGDVDVHKGGHEVLAVEAVHDASVTRDRVGKILTGNRSSARAFTTGHRLEQLDLIIFSKCRTCCLVGLNQWFSKCGLWTSSGPRAKPSGPRGET